MCVCVQDLYGVRSDLGNLLKALGRLEEAKVEITNVMTSLTMSLSDLLC